MTQPTTPDAARAADLDAAHVKWSQTSLPSRHRRLARLDPTRPRTTPLHRPAEGLGMTQPTTPDAARAADLDAAHVKWSQTSLPNRPPFGTFAVNFLLGRGVEVRPAAPTAADLRAVSPCLPESPFIEQALAMGVEDVADLLAALVEWDLSWTAEEHGEFGTLREVQPEPPDLHVVFDCFQTVWQRDDHRADEMHMIEARWFGPSGAARGWAALRRDLGPLTPRDGIAPTTPAQDKP